MNKDNLLELQAMCYSFHMECREEPTNSNYFSLLMKEASSELLDKGSLDLIDYSSVNYINQYSELWLFLFNNPETETWLDISNNIERILKEY